MNIVSASFRHEFYFMVFIPLCSLLPSSPWSWYLVRTQWSFPGKSAGKESTCNAGDPGSIPGLGRSPREEIGYPLQYSWASLMAQIVKNQPAAQETWVWSLVGKIPWRRAWQPTPVFLSGESPWTEEPGGLQSMVAQSCTQLSAAQAEERIKR